MPLAAVDGTVSLHRVWRAGDVLTLVLPMPVRVETRLNDAISLHTG